MTDSKADIQENEIFAISPALLNTLLKDQTLSSNGKQVNIFWATDNYAERGAGYQYADKITLEAITGVNGNVIVPRAVKSREQQKKRSRRMAEVFTPSWLCNDMNNAVDEAWFHRKDVFNTAVELPDNTHTWIDTPGPIEFPEDKSWQRYVSENRLEITCGEAPFLASRYDTVTGEPIPVGHRIGMLDRKLRIVDEHTTTREQWLEHATLALKGTYGYEWQGDNLLLARETMLFTMMECYEAKFHDKLSLETLMEFAEIIAWNIWQMDGLKCVIPNSCFKTPKRVDAKQKSIDFFDEEETVRDKPSTTPEMCECKGCKTKRMHDHNGVYSLIMDWELGKPIKFVSLLPKDFHV